jgi:dipeptidase
MGAMRQCVPVSQRCPYKKPYWDSDLTEAHALQKYKGKLWLLDGRQIGWDHETYRTYKGAKKCFAKLFKAKHIQYEQARFESAEYAYDKYSQSLWKLIKSGNSSFNLHSIVHND